MAWRFPKYPLLVTRTPDIDDLNRNFYEYVEEVGGRLNEHNWDESASNGLTISHMADDIFVWHSASVTQAVDSNTDGHGTGHLPNGGNWFEIVPDPQWRKVTGRP